MTASPSRLHIKGATVDRSEIREKYRLERDKRLRDDAAEQYLPAGEIFDAVYHDPYVPRLERDAIVEELDCVIVGGGFAGLSAGAQLHRAGITDVRIIDRAGDVGGVWYWNRYPGAMCDTAAMVYLPLLEETGNMPSAKYVPGYEIFAHAQKIAQTFDLYDGALFHTNIESATWDESRGRWMVRTDRGDELAARWIVLGTGPIARPKLPRIAGIGTFEGHSFHTSRWDYDYTGGDATGAALDGLAGMRVGVIGTGATGVQIIPHLANSDAELFVFQRTPSAINERNNHPIDPEWYAGLAPGWQDEWQRNFTVLQTGGFADVDLVKDGWTDITQRIRDRVVKLVTERGEYNAAIQREAYEESDDEKMDELRARVDAVVRNRETAEKLKPWYRQLCKRPCFHDSYLNSFNNENVHLVDTDGQGVQSIDATGVTVNGVHYDLDCLIFASGFEVGPEHSGSGALPVVGRGGVSLSDAWSNGLTTLHGIYSVGFPNLFHMGFTQGLNLFSNLPTNFISSATSMSQAVAHARAIGAEIIEPTPEAQAAWVDLYENHGSTFLGDVECTPGYYNNEGAGIGVREKRNANGYPLGAVGFMDFIDEWRRSESYEGLTFTPAP